MSSLELKSLVSLLCAALLLSCGRASSTPPAEPPVLEDRSAANFGGGPANQLPLAEVEPEGDPKSDEEPASAAGARLVGRGEGGEGTGEGTIGLGNTGLIGQGGGGGSAAGYGSGDGSGRMGRREGVPRVRQAKADVEGALDKDIIRRIVRAHINEVRHCYNQGLAQDPNLAGRLTIEFVIGPSGSVSSSKVGSDDLKDASVAMCVAKAIETWKFPKPRGGGQVKVLYPFTLTPR